MALFGRKEGEEDTIVSLVASALRRDISFGVLTPDAKLKLDDLRGRYGGSNHSIREALRILSTEGLVEAEAQRGFRVSSATEADLIDILRLRTEIECTALDWALQNGDVAWEGRVVAAHHALRRAEEAVALEPDDLTALEWDEASRAFHQAVVSASGSPRIIALQTQFYDQSRRFFLAALREGRLDFAARKARLAALVAAILDRDAAAARVALAETIAADLRPAKTETPG